MIRYYVDCAELPFWRAFDNVSDAALFAWTHGLINIMVVYVGAMRFHVGWIYCI